MAQGDFTLFQEFSIDLGREVHNFSSDTVKLGICTTAVTPTAADATPRWSDYVANEVATGNGYTANGETLAGTSYTETAGLTKYDADDVALTQNSSGFTNAGWGILYNDTATNDEAIGFIDMAGPVSLQAGNVTFSWNASGIFTISST